MSIISLFDAEFNVDWLVELTGLKAHEILAELQTEVEKKILTSSRPGIYSIRSLQQRNFGAEISDEDTVELHLNIAKLLIRDLPADDSKWVRLAHHLMKIKNSQECCRFLIMAGDVNRKLYRIDEAFNCYHKTLEDLKAMQNKEADLMFVQAAVKYSKISTANQDISDVIAILDEAFIRAKKWNYVEYQALLKMNMAKNEWLRNNFDKAVEHFESGWALAKKQNDPKLIDSIIAFGTFFLFWQGRFLEAVEDYERSVKGVEEYPLSRFPILGKITMGSCYAHTGCHAEALGILDAIRIHCLERGDLFMASYAIGIIGEIMLDMRKLDDAIYHMEQSSEMSLKTNNGWVFMLSQIFLAFTYYLKGNTSRSIQLLNIFLKKRNETGSTVLPYAYLLELIWELKQKNIPEIKGLSINEEIDRMIFSRNIFMQGVGYRFKALLMEKEHAEPENTVDAYKSSILFLEKSGNKVELARSLQSLSRYLLNNGDQSLAQEIELRIINTLSTLDKKFIPDDIQFLVNRELGSDNFLKEILKLSKEIVKIGDYGDLFQKIIISGSRVTGAERGAIFMLEKDESGENRLYLKASRNLTADDVERSDFSSSMNMIKDAYETGRGNIGQVDSCGDLHVSNSLIRSKICVPMNVKNNILGVLYYDNRILSSTFKESDLDILSYFATVAAVSIDNDKAYRKIAELNTKLVQEKQYLEEENLTNFTFEEIIGAGREIKLVLTKIQQVAETDATVLITGETGVGKELVARAIHRCSQRKNNKFIGLQLGALSKELIGSELLGHEKGSFTGANLPKIGRFELANGGTLFLDEISDISLDIQIQLLRVLQTRQFERVGGTQTIQSDFRLIAATNRNLLTLIQDGSFRSDLYYRLNVFPIHIPPLRERKEDIPLLAYHFLKMYALKFKKNIISIPNTEMQKLISYYWPGNIRELQNIIERGAILSSKNIFHMPKLEIDNQATTEVEENGTLEENERWHIVRTLRKTGGKVAGATGAAAMLGIPPSTLSFKIKRLGIQRSEL
jgi:transcriptional regulator with GAF, ATPase, and Fis domain